MTISPLLMLAPALFASGFAKPIAVEQTQTTEAPTCEGKTAGSTFSFSTSSGSYDILCGTDYWGGDLSSQSADTFETCLKACDSATGCVSVSYSGNNCYLKQTLTDAVSSTNVWAAKRHGAAKGGVSCVGNVSHGTIYQSAKSKFDIICGKDYYGSDLAVASTSSFEACIEACDANAQCVDVSYVNGACYLKDKTTTAADAGHVWTALRVVAATKDDTIKTDAAALSCVDGKDNGKSYAAKSGGMYGVECGTDYGGGDMKSVGTDTFEACMDACDVTAGCIDVSWVWGTCYLKDKIGTGSALGHVWTGRQIITPEEAAIKDLHSNGEAFCSSFIGYEPPVTVQQTVTTPEASTSTVFTTVTTTTTAFSTAKITRTTVQTLTPVVQRRQALATPSLIANWDASRISSACSQVATGISTSIAVSTASVAGVTAIATAVSVVNVTRPTTVTTTVTSTTSIAPGPSFAPLDFESGKLNDYLKDVLDPSYKQNNALSISIANEGHSRNGVTSTKSLKITHTNSNSDPDLMWLSGAGIPQATIPQSAVGRWYKIEFSFRYDYDAGTSSANCQTIVKTNRYTSVANIIASSQVPQGTNQRAYASAKRCDTTQYVDPYPLQQPNTWQRYTAYTKVQSAGELWVTAVCWGRNPAQNMWIDDITMTEEKC